MLPYKLDQQKVHLGLNHNYVLKKIVHAPPLPPSTKQIVLKNPPPPHPPQSSNFVS